MKTKDKERVDSLFTICNAQQETIGVMSERLDLANERLDLALARINQLERRIDLAKESNPYDLNAIAKIQEKHRSVH